MHLTTLESPITFPAKARSIVVSTATSADRDLIGRLRHDVYARELAQYDANDSGCLHDRLEGHNVVLVARSEGPIAGFIAITPPGAGPFSVERYFAPSLLPVLDKDTYEIRALTVRREFRGSDLALLLMYAGLRWVESHGGKRVVAIGRREVLDLYLRLGLRRVGPAMRAGAVHYELLLAEVEELRATATSLGEVFDRIEERTIWRLPFSFRAPAPCFHGGAFFTAIGEKFEALERRHGVINADVLDAWFPPAPGVIDSLQADLPWLLRTSPPTQCEGLVDVIAEARAVSPSAILPGAGSSDLMFRALRHWLTPDSHALILDPTYGEYPHVLERVIGCQVDRLRLRREADYAVDVDCLAAACDDRYDLIVLVNPNSPTGGHIPRNVLEPLLARAPVSTRIWVDETYVEYAGPDQSVERFAAASENVIVCKSMSKVYALSGARAAYLCAGAHQLEALRAITPPWVIGLPSQVAAARALKDPAYYAARYAETAILRTQLAAGLFLLRWTVQPGIANFLLCHLPEDGPDAATVVARAAGENVFIRNAASMSPLLGNRCVRLAVKDAVDNSRMLEVLTRAVAQR